MLNKLKFVLELLKYLEVTQTKTNKLLCLVSLFSRHYYSSITVIVIVVQFNKVPILKRLVVM